MKKIGDGSIGTLLTSPSNSLMTTQSLLERMQAAHQVLQAIAVNQLD